MEFKKYMHVERFGSDEVEGIEIGECFVFPKLDGTNASLWVSDGVVQAGSRQRHLSLDSDNAGFYAWAIQQENIKEFFKAFPQIRLYGEWLVPHSLKTYRDDAWNKLYVFDVEENDTILSFSQYAAMLAKYDISFVHPICVLKNATYDALLKELDNNTFLIQDGRGSGEGIVLKNYSFQNRFGRVVWAKIVTNSFKETHVKEMGSTVKNCKQMVEQEIVDTFVGKHMIDKVYAKIVNESQGWNSRYIPRLLSTVFYDLVREEMWEAIKMLKNPIINFKTLNTITILKIKELRPELF